MNILTFLKFVDIHVKEVNKKVENPFTSKNFSYNSLDGIFKRTSIWVDEKNKKRY